MLNLVLPEVLPAKPRPIPFLDMKDKFLEETALYLMTDYAITQYETCSDGMLDDEGYFFHTSMPGATCSQEIATMFLILKNAFIENTKNQDDGSIFEYGTEREMLWSELWEQTRDHLMDLEQHYHHTWLDKIDKDAENAITVLDEYLSFDCVSILSGFYPHSWPEPNEISNVHKLHREVEYLVDRELYKKINQTVEIDNSKPLKKINEIAKPEPKQPKSLYLMKDNATGFYKIGVSKSPNFREKTLQAEKPSIKMVASWPAMGKYEKPLHKHFTKHRVRGEWFDLTEAQVRFVCHLITKTPDQIDETLCAAV